MNSSWRGGDYVLWITEEALKDISLNLKMQDQFKKVMVWINKQQQQQNVKADFINKDLKPQFWRDGRLKFDILCLKTTNSFFSAFLMAKTEFFNQNK